MKSQYINISTVMLVRLCVLAIMVIAYSGCDNDPPPPPPPDTPSWSICGCDETSGYTLTVNADSYTVDPVKAEYTKGELVTITYIPPADRRLLFWTVDPPSHLSNYSEETSISVYITNHTTVTAYTANKLVRIGVFGASPWWGGTISHDIDIYDVEYGSEFTITASPNPGFRFAYWESSTINLAVNNGFQYLRNSITVKAEGNHSYKAFFVSDDNEMPTLYDGSVLLAGEGTAEVFTGSAYTSSGMAPFPYYNSATPCVFDALCRPNKGYGFVFWSYINADNLLVYQTTSSSIYPGIGYYLGQKRLCDIGENGFEAYLQKTVSLDIEIEGQGIVTSPNFRVSWNPLPYQPPHGPAKTELISDDYGNSVTMTGSPCPGWEFSHWEIRDSNYELHFAGNAEQMTVYMNWWGNNNIYHVPILKDTLYVKAVFLQPWIIVLSGEYFSSGDPNQSGLKIFYDNLADCYLKSYYDEDVIEPDGKGALYTEIMSKRRSGEIESIVLIGHSHGGGSIADLCDLMADTNQYLYHNYNNIRPPTIRMTAYVDAIQQALMPWEAETRYPMGSLFHANMYQQIDKLLTGFVTNPNGYINPNLDINNLPFVEGVDHGGIDNCQVTHAILMNRLDKCVNRRDLLEPMFFGFPPYNLHCP